MFDKYLDFGFDTEKFHHTKMLPLHKTYVDLFYFRIPPNSKKKRGHVQKEVDLKIPYIPKVIQVNSPVSLQQLEADSKEITVNASICSVGI